MSSNFQDTEAGGEQTQYEASAPDVESHKKSSGQLGSPDDQTTTDPSQTQERKQANADKAEQKAESNRQEKDLTEGGMGGKTNSDGEAR